jgi:DNA-binding beta-propeller fold protein YncE
VLPPGAHLSQVHGVLVVPARHRVFVTATGANMMVALDEDTGAVLARVPTGEFPDGLAYDPRRGAIWTTNESGGSETVIDAGTGAVRGTVALGGEVGNVAYDPTGDRMLVDVQSHNELAVIDPAGWRSPGGCRCRAAYTTTGWRWTRPRGWRSWPATPTRPC